MKVYYTNKTQAKQLLKEFRRTFSSKSHLHVPFYRYMMLGLNSLEPVPQEFTRFLDVGYYSRFEVTLSPYSMVLSFKPKGSYYIMTCLVEEVKYFISIPEGVIRDLINSKSYKSVDSAIEAVSSGLPKDKNMLAGTLLFTAIKLYGLG